MISQCYRHHNTRLTNQNVHRKKTYWCQHLQMKMGMISCEFHKLQWEELGKSFETVALGRVLWSKRRFQREKQETETEARKRRRKRALLRFERARRPRVGEAADGDGNDEEGMLSFLRCRVECNFWWSVSQQTRPPTRGPQDFLNVSRSVYIANRQVENGASAARLPVVLWAVALAVSLVLLISVLVVHGRRRQSSAAG